MLHSVTVRSRTPVSKIEQNSVCSNPALHGKELFREEAQRNSFTHGLVACRTRMQVVTAIVGWKHVVGILRIADGGIKINDRVKMTRGTDPGIHSLTIRFVDCVRMVIA